MPSTHPLIGKQAPALSLPSADGSSFELTPGAAGVPAVIFFYPKSGTYGCTKEACDFRDALAERQEFKTTKAQVVGISGDSIEKQKEFVEKQKLTYPVLSDSNGEARTTYNVGKGLLGLTEARTTFVIDAKGVVRDVFDSVLNFGAHVKFVTQWLDKLQKEENETATTVISEPPAQE